jgi:DNA mismatch repair protein MSH6
MSTPRPSQKKQPPSSSQSAKGQKSILGFFQKKSTNSPSPAPSQPTPANQTPTLTLTKKSFSRPPPALTPVASSDAPEPSSPIRQEEEDTPVAIGRNKENGLPSRVSAPCKDTDRVASEVAGVALSSPSRKVRQPNILQVDC